MSAIEQCRTAALGGHALRCTDCDHLEVSYNSCRNRHCPKCQGRAAQRWLEARQGDLLPVEYYHVVFTLPAPIAAIAYSNKAAIYRLLFDVAADTLTTIAADPKHLGAKIGATLVLHTWGSALTHHPHVHGIVPGGGMSADGERWVACRRGFFLPVRVLSRLFRRRFLEALEKLHRDGQLQFFGEHEQLADAGTFSRWLSPLRDCEWVVYAKRPFAGPEAVLAYLSRYTHRVAILEPAPGFDGRRRCDIPLEGLPRQGAYPEQDDEARLPRSSCAASSCTCCPAASTAFATTGCWPTPSAAPAWPKREPCSMCRA